ncbi:metallophosphoesterase [Sutcliffiella horikoshii]|uniref:Metallophosphoesterase n=1 Tax=Sutcliffiella horikoshii TaxID=79883 RepID=A0AA95B762_9BACI|nr:metallophosphoesterase [Sutcliffiella horikoshii]TYS60096.1 metallophosphoesterase [Sutcliffiella horikoshii]
MKRVNWKVIFFIIIAFIIIYIIVDNNRIKIVEEQIEIEGLSDSLDGFTILQVTDLHEKEFGHNQKSLIKKINSKNYDVIVFTGDMLDDMESLNYEPFFDLIEGIKNMEYAFFVPGNTDPLPYLFKEKGIERHEFIEEMEKRGVQFLETNTAVNVNQAVVRIVYFENSIISEKRIEAYKESVVNENYPPLVRLKMKHYEENLVLDQEEAELLIALNHYPVADLRIDSIEKDSYYQMRDYDLILAGHYHGGQYRVPFLGAFFVPEAYFKRNGLFPPQNRVKGLWEYKGIKQYISAGLGSSDTIPFMKFRLFNTPEINVITFVSKQ